MTWVAGDYCKIHSDAWRHDISDMIFRITRVEDPGTNVMLKVLNRADDARLIALYAPHRQHGIVRCAVRHLTRLSPLELLAAQAE